MSSIHLKTALDYIRRSPFQALAAIFVLSLTFFVATLVFVLAYSSSQLISYFETRPQVIAFLKDDATEDEVAALQHRLEGDTRIKEVKYVSKEEALSIYKKATSDNPLLGELVSPSIFPASLEFSVNDLNFAQSIIDEVKTEKNVDSVGFTAALGGESSLKDVVGRLRTITMYVRVGGLIFTGILALASFVVLLITISMRIATRREEVEILNLIGATQGFIRSPIIIEAFIYAVLGVVLGWIIAFTAILYLAPSAVLYFGEIPVLPRDTLSLFALFGVILGVELVSGFVLALSGSLFAISRVRRSR
ncbi:MAG: Cell division protein FtsX [Candidatus Woesebacteria bacterium GW2011_GWB1_45_5]|uniref:Cell division protein FtsX n=1 Tax=Candidatus Woesebacteria bacterium GW2011_GWB1_45_5 TaxID=1618581 RepID=A0A0G1MME3_9BACT|nr:MAG: Cell division protein FtsX [Candidatus Woesebacteria bacterium GW2011_GWB1_45_5]